MPDLSHLSDDELDRLIAQKGRARSVQDLSDDELDAAIAAKAPKSWGETALDVAESAGTGVMKGALAIPGIMGDAQRLGDWTDDWASR